MSIDKTGDGTKITGLKFTPWQTRIFLTPRQQLPLAPLHWFQLQRNWWRGTADVGPPVPPLERKLATFDEMIVAAQNVPLSFPPGGRQEYNNFNFAVIGKLIETLTGGFQPFGRFLDSRMMT